MKNQSYPVQIMVVMILLCMCFWLLLAKYHHISWQHGKPVRLTLRIAQPVYDTNCNVSCSIFNHITSDPRQFWDVQSYLVPYSNPQTRNLQQRPPIFQRIRRKVALEAEATIHDGIRHAVRGPYPKVAEV